MTDELIGWIVIAATVLAFFSGILMGIWMARDREPVDGPDPCCTVTATESRFQAQYTRLYKYLTLYGCKLGWEDPEPEKRIDDWIDMKIEQATEPLQDSLHELHQQNARLRRAGDDDREKLHKLDKLLAPVGLLMGWELPRNVPPHDSALKTNWFTVPEEYHDDPKETLAARATADVPSMSRQQPVQAGSRA